MDYIQLNDGNRIPAIGFGVFMIPNERTHLSSCEGTPFVARAGVGAATSRAQVRATKARQRDSLCMGYVLGR